MRTHANICRPDGTQVDEQDAMTYLGSRLSSDGRIGTELGRRIGLALQDFRTLKKVWRHSSISYRRKLLIFDACVISKLIYGLFTAILNKAERRRLDGFQARCLRQIFKMLPSFYSRVSNKEVLGRAESCPLSTKLARQQIKFMGQLARRVGADPIRRSIFKDEGCDLRKPEGTRRRGRPRAAWGATVLKNCTRAGLRLVDFAAGHTTEKEWQAAVRAYHI